MVDTSVMIKDYKNGISLNGIAKKYNFSQYKFKKVLKQNNIHVRSRNEQNYFNPQNQRVYTVADNYFSIQSKNMAYLLGFISADGCIYEKKNLLKIGLSSTDKDFLKLIKTELQSDAPISDYQTKDGFQVSELKISSRKIKQDLAFYNIVPRKTYAFTFPEKLKEEFRIDFIRGYFDGDGSISTAGKALRWQICAYNKNILESIIEILFQCGIPKVNIMQQRNLYYFQYSTNATKQLFDILYYPNCFCLERKYKKYQTLLMK